MSALFQKIKRRIWNEIVSRSRKFAFYPYLYCSVWHSLLFHSKQQNYIHFYFSARPNPGAGIGHQMANWIAGYWWAKQFQLKFAHIPFSLSKWEEFLGFGENETKVEALKYYGFKRVRLPLWEQYDEKQISKIKRIIQSYSGKKIVFVCEQDQGYAEQYGVMDDIQQKFYSAKARENDKLVYDEKHFNIAIHVRRGDIELGKQNNNQNLLMRWMDNDYYHNVLDNVLKVINVDKSIAIYLFSQGTEEDFIDFNSFPNLHFCLKMNAQDSFLHMVYADLLITSKSSFSYKPALLNKGIKVCPKNFWHNYPEKNDWILVDENGSLFN